MREDLIYTLMNSAGYTYDSLSKMSILELKVCYDTVCKVIYK